MAKARLVPITKEDLIVQRMNQLHASVAEVTRGQLSPSLPQFDPDFPTDAVNGQICMQGGLPYYFYNGDWLPFSSSPTRTFIGDTLYYFDGIPEPVPDTSVSGYSLDVGEFRFFWIKAIALSGYAPVGSESYFVQSGIPAVQPEDFFSPGAFGLSKIAGVTRLSYLEIDSQGFLSPYCFTAISTPTFIGDNSPATASAGDVFFAGMVLVTRA